MPSMKEGASTSTCSTLLCHVIIMLFSHITEPPQSPAFGILAAYQKKPIKKRLSAKAHFHRTSRICAFVIFLFASQKIETIQTNIEEIDTFQNLKASSWHIEPLPPPPPPAPALSLSLSLSVVLLSQSFIYRFDHI
jgi:hypothetical protein